VLLLKFFGQRIKQRRFHKVDRNCCHPTHDEIRDTAATWILFFSKWSSPLKKDKPAQQNKSRSKLEQTFPSFPLTASFILDVWMSE
jgi:hypothetical protein